MFVNMRGKSAAKILQKACVDLRENVVIDGIVGPLTLFSLNRLSRAALVLLQERVRYHQKEFYNQIVKRDPTQTVFLNGWINRARL